MKFLLLVAVLQLFALGVRGEDEKGEGVVQGAKTFLSKVVNTVSDTIKTVPLAEGLLFPGCVEPEAVCPNVNVTFWYYTNDNPNPQKLSVNDERSLENLDRSNPWKILIHGYTKSKEEIPNPELRTAYFKRGRYNIISVDYEPLARDKCYIQAVNNVPLIANCTAQMIDSLIDHQVFRSDNLHVIGFSLGAQVAGLIHTFMRHHKPSRVTGLDPASPLFDGVVNEKLSKESGDFVDVVHTNALMKGMLTRAGHIDFYVNGGITQPGCREENDESYSTCNHNRSPLYFAESINSQQGFWGIPCDSYVTFLAGGCNTEEDKLVLMGEDVPRNANGSYYLQTTDKPPYSLGKISKASAKKLL